MKPNRKYIATLFDPYGEHAISCGVYNQYQVTESEKDLEDLIDEWIKEGELESAIKDDVSRYQLIKPLTEWETTFLNQIFADELKHAEESDATDPKDNQFKKVVMLMQKLGI